MSTLSPTAGSRPGTPHASGVSPAPGERSSANPSAGAQDSYASTSLPGRVEKPNRGLGNNAINDFTIMRDKRDSRYDLRNRARELAKSVPAIQANALREKQVQLYNDAVREAAQHQGKLFSKAEQTPVFQSHRLALCGRAMRAGADEVVFRESALSAGITNLQSCGSYACPVCGPKIAHRRFEEVRQVLTVAKAQGFEVAMVTMTMRHSQADSLERLWDGLLAGWREAITATDWVGESEEAYTIAKQDWETRGALHEQGLGRAPRGWKKQKGIFRDRRIGEREKLGVFAPIRSVELTRGKSGWHPHVHALFVFKAHEDGFIQALKIGSFFHKKFQSGIADFGLESIKNSGGLDVQLMGGTAEAIAGYATKMSLEATRSDLKKGRAGGETPLQLLERAVEGEADAITAWLDFATVSQGKRWLTISKKLRELAQLGAEQSDEEIADEETDGLDVASVSAQDWKAHRLWLSAAALLRALEERGAAGLYSELDSRKVSYRSLSTPPPEG